MAMTATAGTFNNSPPSPKQVHVTKDTHVHTVRKTGNRGRSYSRDRDNYGGYSSLKRKSETGSIFNY